MGTSDWIAVTNVIATFLAILAAPLVAIWIGGKLQKRSERERAKLTILGTLISLRHDPSASEAIRSLNLIDAIFVDNDAVREAWTRYFAVLSDQALNNPVGWSFREEKRRDLLLAMVASVKWAGKLSSSDLLRTYIPQMVQEQTRISYLERQIKLKQLEEAALQLNIPFSPSSTPPQTPPIPPITEE